MSCWQCYLTFQKKVRKKAGFEIFEAQKRAERRDQSWVRKFVTLPVNMEASSYIDLVNWQRKDQIFEDPMTLKFSDEDLLQQINNEHALEVPDALYHTQSTERLIKLVTEVSSRVFGFKNRHYEILNTIQSQKHMPKFDNKSMFTLSSAELK